MAITNGNKEWMTSGGNWRNKKYIARHIQDRDATVSRMFKKIFDLEQKMIKAKQEVIKMGLDYIERNKKRVELKDGDKITGNISLSDYANLHVVQFTSDDVIEFDDQLNIAKAIMDKCIREWNEKGTHPYIREIMNDAFQVDKKGKISVGKVLDLTTHNFPDKEWQRAIGLIKDSIQKVGKRQYLKFKYRETQQDEWKTVNLHFSKL